MTETILTSIAVTLRILSNPAANVIQKQLTQQKNHPLFVNFVTYLLLSIISIFLPFSLHGLAFDFWLYSVLGGVCGAVGNAFIVKALEKGDLSVLGPINSYKSVVGLIVAIILLNEWPNLWGLIGIALIIYGSYFVLDTTEEKFSLAVLKRKEIQYRAIAMVLTAIEAVFVKKVILTSSIILSFFSWATFGAIFSLVLVLFTGLKPQKHQYSFQHAGKFLSLAAFIGIMQFTTNYTFEHMPVGYALSLFQLSGIITVLLGYQVFREQHVRKKLLGSLIMVAGSVMIILLKDQ